jgi:hypothetical protein
MKTDTTVPVPIALATALGLVACDATDRTEGVGDQSQAFVSWRSHRTRRCSRPRLLNGNRLDSSHGPRLLSLVLCGVVLKSYMTILHCLANEIYLELLG